jgi:hypothetical protein
MEGYMKRRFIYSYTCVSIYPLLERKFYFHKNDVTRNRVMGKRI